ncbi:MAG: lactate utilization protein, partial [Thiomargarita sp.]|nr:lactate utilization protein [Thiomargarita sp.]
TGQEMTSYTTLSTGPRRAKDVDGPEEFHVVLVDNGRSELLAGDFSEMLQCIRCGACLNHCPVYGAIGGHAYGWVYPGPMGSVLTSLFLGLKEAGDLPHASTLCGHCEEVCPMSIPLPKLLHQLRTQKPQTKWLIGLWAFFAKRPRLYHRFSSLVGKVGYIPFIGSWTKTRHMPIAEKETFMTTWNKK